jgi:hypothetical protein
VSFYKQLKLLCGRTETIRTKVRAERGRPAGRAHTYIVARRLTLPEYRVGCRDNMLLR